MINQSIALRVLVTLYRAASRGQIVTETRLCRLTEIESSELVSLLRRLDRAGFVDREQLRLTLSGLAIAVAASRKPKTRTLSKAA
jgi:hypothetical protein